MIIKWLISNFNELFYNHILDLFKLSNDLGIATRPNPDDPTMAQWRPRGTDGEWRNFTNPTTLNGRVVGGIAGSGSIIFNKPMVNVTLSLSNISSDEGGYLPYISIRLKGGTETTNNVTAGTFKYDYVESLRIYGRGSGHWPNAPGVDYTITFTQL